jgi:transmembrane sensor
MDNQRFEELLIRDLTGDLTPDERRELLGFLQTDTGRRREQEILKDFWAQKEVTYADTHSIFEKIKDRIRLQEEASGLPGHFAPPVPAPDTVGPVRLIASTAEPIHHTATGRRRLVWRSAAAALLFILGGYGIFHYYFSGRQALYSLAWQEKYTERKSMSKMILADGSSVTLNADSRLKYPAIFDGPNREVYLTGEAFFDIQKDPDHPFIIHTDKMTIRVLGTSFNVKSYPGDAVMETTLLKGSVEVTFPDRPADKIILRPSDKLVIRNATAMADSATDVTAGKEKAKAISKGSPETKYTLTGLTYYRNQHNTIVETSWVDNKLVFSNEEFQSVARRMERWYGVSIVFDREDLKTIPFTGYFQKENITEALYALQLSEKFRYSVKDSVIHIY